MAQLLHFVLFAAFVASSYSYSIDRRRSQLEPEMPPELQEAGYNGYDDDSYPEEYIENLIAALSPEDLEKLKIDRNYVEDRIGNGSSSSEFCSWYLHEKAPTELPAADISRTIYYVVNTKTIKQSFQIQVCDSKNENRCFGNATEIVTAGNKGCCFPKEESIEMIVLSVPKEEFNKNKGNVKSKLVSKNMYLNTKCVCENVVQGPDDGGQCNILSKI